MAKQVEFLSGDDMDAILALVDEDIIEKEADFGAVIDKSLSQVRN